MRFLFIGPGFCLRLPSDSTSRWTPLPLANGSHCQAHSGLSPPSYCPCRAHWVCGQRCFCVVQAGLELVGNLPLGLSTNPCLRHIHNRDILKLFKESRTLSRNLPYHVSLGLCPYIPSFCFRDKSGDSLMLKCCLSGLME